MPNRFERPITIYTVAEEAGVSIATVSRVLQGSTPTSAATRQKVLDAVEQLGYVPLRTGRSTSMRLETHGLVLATVGGPYYSELLTGYEATTSTVGQSVTLLPAESVGDDLRERILDLASKTDGMVFGHAAGDDDLVAEVARRIPVITVNRAPVAGCDSVTIDNLDQTVAIVRHVIEHGRTRLRFVGDPEQSRDVERRYAGFLQTLSEFGMRDESGPLRVAFDEAAGMALGQQLVGAADQFDALICANDELALALMLQLQRAGITVPDDIAITGWDGIMAGRYTSPPLTTVVQPIRQLGRVVAERLHERIATGAGAGAPITLPCELVLGGTCGCPVPAGVMAPR